jgi:four helix bundle protein
MGAGYRDLKVWQKAMDDVVECYEYTGRFPKSEMYGLASQLQKCAVSVAANIAEGQGRGYAGEFLHHLGFAYGSLMESETHIQLAERLGYCSAEAAAALLDRAGEIGRMLNGLMNSLDRNRK